MELDDAYQNGAYIADGDSYPGKWAAASEAFRATALKTLNVSYGPRERNTFDLFRPGQAARGTVVFVHGGYWLESDKSSWSYLASGALAHGWAVAMPSYDLCPSVRISDITQQISAAVGVISTMTRGPLRLTGHSAGGHLVARMLDPGVAGTWLDKVERVMPISPLGDLAPLLKTSMNEALRLTPSEARAESPIYQPRPTVPVSVAVGADERPAFLEQAAGLSRVWGCEQRIYPGKHHFDVIDDLARTDSDMIAHLLS